MSQNDSLEYESPRQENSEQQVQTASTVRMQTESMPELPSGNDLWRAGSQAMRELTSLLNIRIPDTNNPNDPYRGQVDAAHQCPLNGSCGLMSALGLSSTTDRTPLGQPPRATTDTPVSVTPPAGATPDVMASPPATSDVTTVVPGADAPVRTNDTTASPSDRVYTDGERAAMEQYAATLQDAGIPREQAQLLSRQLMNRLQDGRDHNNGTPEQQMRRIEQGARDILTANGTGRDDQGRRIRADGQLDTLSDQNRRDMVRDLAHRVADPNRFCNQGEHMTCALQSMQNQNLQAGDPAREIERMRDIVNRGSTVITQRDGTQRTVTVNSNSYAPDGESSRPFDDRVHGDRGARGVFGHVGDALYGQMAANLRAERENLPPGSYVYMAAHADQLGGRNGQTRTGEGLFRRQNDGSFSLVANNPGVNVWGVAHLSRAMGGQEGAVFAHAGLVADGPPAGYPRDLRITTFNTPAEFRQQLQQWQDRTGQSAQIAVNAPFLRRDDGRQPDGHGMHAMTASIRNGEVYFDNNWGNRHDNLGNRVTDAEINRAMNPESWGISRQPGGQEPGPRPTDRTEFRPGTGTNPNESSQQARERQDAERREEQRREDQRRDDQRRDDRRSEEDRNRDRQQERLDQERRLQESRNRLARAMAEWESRRNQATARQQRFDEARPQDSQA